MIRAARHHTAAAAARSQAFLSRRQGEAASRKTASRNIRVWVESAAISRNTRHGRGAARGGTYVVYCAHVRSALQQQCHDRRVAEPRSAMESRVANLCAPNATESGAEKSTHCSEGGAPTLSKCTGRLCAWLTGAVSPRRQGPSSHPHPAPHAPQSRRRPAPPPPGRHLPRAPCLQRGSTRKGGEYALSLAPWPRGGPAPWVHDCTTLCRGSAQGHADHPLGT